MVALIVTLAIVVIVAFIVIGIYNRLVTLRQQQRNSFSQIDVQLTRRYELIPNLVESAKAYMQHEQATLEKVILARNQAFEAKKHLSSNPTDAGAMGTLLQAEGSVKAALGSFLAVSESYPELRSNENMQMLMEELSSTENKVAFSRQAYNDATMEYNTAREVFPASIIANMFGFMPAALYQTEEPEARKAVKVSFK